MKHSIYILLALILSIIPIQAFPGNSREKVSTRQERKAIMAGNDLYKKSKYAEAANKYREALRENPSSTVGTYNLGLTNLRLAAAPGVSEEKRKNYETEAKKLLDGVISLGASKSELASRASYNLGNLAFNSEDYQSALQYYKQALRLNPKDDQARRNLRITQLKLKNQNQNKDNKNKDQDQNNKDQDKDKKENKDKENKDKENKDKQDKKEDNNKDRQQKPQQEKGISEQTADQILKAMETKEAQTRQRVMNPQKNVNGRPSRKNW